MATTIKPLTSESVKVNNKVVFLNKDGRWVAVSELSNAEKEAFVNYYEAYIKEPIKPLPLKTY